MAQFRKKPVAIEAITFDELVAHGISEIGIDACHNGMPWSFKYTGQAVSHENDDCYLIQVAGETQRLNRTDMLVTGETGLSFVLDREMFLSLHEPVGVVETTARQKSPVAADYEENFLVIHSDKEGSVIGINHPCDAAWSDVLVAHTAVRDRLNERIAARDSCPFKGQSAK